MSLRAKICQIVPTTFHGTSNGIASKTSTSDERHPSVGIDKRECDAERELNR